jgi:hypothetical protein
VIDGEAREAELLARARRGVSPTAVDAARVRRAIGAALGAGAGDFGATPAKVQGDPERRWVAAPRAGRWAWRLLVAGAIAAAGIGAGYRAGRRAGLREARLTSSATEPSATETSGGLSVARRSAGALAPVATGTPSALRLDAPPIGSPSGSGDLPPSTRRRNPAGKTAFSPAPSPAESLEIEVRALRNIERALRDGNPGLALAFLQELDRAVPRGQLTEERTATAALARCARGDLPFGVNLAEDFANQYPYSVYRERVEQACAPTDSTAPGDSSGRRPPR